MTNFIKHAPKGFYLLFLNWSWLSTPLSAPPARKYILPLKFLWMEERGADLTPGLCCRAASHSSQPCSPVLAASLTRIISSRTCPALHRPLLLPALLLLPHGLWNPELGAAGRLQVMGSSASAEITDWEKEPALFISLTFCQQTWTFPSLLLTLISSVKLKILMGNTSNTFIRLPGVPCRSWLHVRDWSTQKLGMRRFNSTEGIWMPSIH